MIFKLKNFVAKALAGSGRRVTRFPLARYLNDFQIDCVLDVGANVGQYAKEIRSLGYKNTIESFEPLPSAFAKLQEAAKHDSQWNIHRYALGVEPGIMPIHISANSPSSSFLEMDDKITTSAVDLSVVGTVDVEIRRLDDVFKEVCENSRHIYLKIDTQGFERHVIEGGLNSLPRISAVQMELALVPNYRGESLIEEIVQLMRKQKFVPWWLMDGFRNPRTLQMYQTDVFFVRQDISDARR